MIVEIMIRKQLFGDRCDNDRRGRTQFYLEDRSDSSDRCDHEKLLSRNFSDRFDEKYINTAKYNITYVQEFMPITSCIAYVCAMAVPPKRSKGVVNSTKRFLF